MFIKLKPGGETMVDAKKLSIGVAVVGIVQLILTYTGGGGAVNYILALLVVILGIMGATNKGSAAAV